MNGNDIERLPGRVRKITVEECSRLSMKVIKPLQPGSTGRVPLVLNGIEEGDVGYQVLGSGGAPTAVRLMHSFDDLLTGASMDHDYLVALTTTLTAWGSLRYWFVCPLVVDGIPCGRRVEVLYLPTGKAYFGCRQCHNLAYQSGREGCSTVRELKMATSAQYPYLTPTEVSKMVSSYLKGEPTPARIERKIWTHAEEERKKALPDPYAGYLSAAELCERSELRPSALEQLASARLLLPDYQGKYRPKLVGWAAKLAYLLAEGWSLAEIRAWSRGRWSTSNPRQFPPDRERWSNAGVSEEEVTGNGT